MAPDNDAMAGKSLGCPINSDLAFHVLPRGSTLPPVGRPSPIHNKTSLNGNKKPRSRFHSASCGLFSCLSPREGHPSPTQEKFANNGKTTSDSKHHEGSEHQEGSGDVVSSSLTDEKRSLSSSEVMPRNENPPPHGPSPAGNKKTDLLDFAAPSTTPDREILEGFPAGSGESQPEHTSKHESDEPNTPHATKEEHQGDTTMKNGAAVGKTVGGEPNDDGLGTGPDLKLWKAPAS